MTWFYSQKSGVIAHDTEIVGCGYSGNDDMGPCKNNPAAQTIRGHGPIPRGKYKMLAPCDHPRLGPCTIPLVPDPTNNMFGRCGFFCHGDSIARPGHASDGCIIQDHCTRDRMWFSGDHELEVRE